MRRATDVVIIGAGPYGLSLGAHLAARGANFKIFGDPMAVWRSHMPPGMYLKSEGFASDLFDPKRERTLRAFCERNGHSYADVGVPIPLDVFYSYGLEFQRHLLPELDTRLVTHLAVEDGVFTLCLDDGEEILARKVVTAVGITHYAHIPPELAGLPPELFSHTSQQRPVEQYSGRRIAVIGAGSSAVDMAGLLHQAGAETQILTRRPKIWFHHPPDGRRGLDLAAKRLLKPRSGLGLGWRSRMASDLPLVFHNMPERFRLRVTKGHLGPAAGWVSRQLVEGKVNIRLNMHLRHAKANGKRAHLFFKNAGGETEEVEADHIIAGTGYKVDLDRLAFLSTELRERIRNVQNTPILSSHFESTVRGLYFVGPSAANSFGPLMRFAWGAKFAARHLANHLTR
jgi:cation diffusion facilitator CzcD-associated flavoprotein CzcO